MAGFVAASSLLLVVPGCAARSTPPSPRLTAAAVVIPVTLGDFTIQPRAFKMKAGKVVFRVTNAGATDYDFRIPALEASGERQPHLLKPGETRALEYDLRPGTYRILCTIPGDREASIVGSLEVLP
jgi:uncharacterized cupredoxin-like copper-binding protein